MPQSRRKEILHFHFKTLAMPQYKNLCLGGHKIYNFGRPFLDHHYYFLSLSDLCLGVEMFLQEIIFTIWLGCPCLCLEGHETEFTVKVDLPWSSWPYPQYVWSMPGSKEIFDFLKINTAFSLFDLYGHVPAQNPWSRGH